MRYVRIVMVAAIAAGALAVPSAAIAQISTISIGQPQLGPQGASLSVPVKVQCDTTWNLETVSVTVSQSSGRFLAQGFGSAFWGVPCVGPGTIVIPVANTSFVVFKKGSVAVTASVTVMNEATFAMFTKTATETVKVTNKPISYVDPFSRAAARRAVRRT